MMNKKDKWIEDTALFYFRIFSAEYGDLFLDKLLKGGGGNSTLCASWYQLSPVFVPERISATAYNLLIEKGFHVEKNKDVVTIKNAELKSNHGMFYNNAKGSKKRIIAGKFFHFDHNPSNKKILSLLNEKVRSYMESLISESEILNNLAEYIKTIQTVDLITVEQDELRTNADCKANPLSSDERDDIINDVWYILRKI